jgi:squalene-hopene/tetraprenyl-beta-curcumene cyclase
VLLQVSASLNGSWTRTLLVLVGLVPLSAEAIVPTNGRFLSAADIEPVTLENYEAPSANTADEPLAAEFSVTQAARFLDAASLHWQDSRSCFACHTNYAYLTARPLIGFEDPACRSVRAAAEELVVQRWPDKGPRWDAEVVATAHALSTNDALTTGTLHPVTRQALDRIWTVQRDDGGFSWLKCGWPPMESDDEYGALLAAIAVGVAPEDYRQTPAARAGLERLKQYLSQTPMPTLHHRAMLVWVSKSFPDWMKAADRDAVLAELFARQQPDGGWSAASLGNWERGDGTEQQVDVSDGYGTAFVMYVARQGGVAASDDRLQHGVQWLKTHQRESGRWYARSLFKDNKHYLSHAASAWAILALAECDALPVDPREETSPR